MERIAAVSKTLGILQPSYLPWLGAIEQIWASELFVLYDDVQFDKGGWRNRNRIKTPQGPLWLTVPVLTKGGGFPLIRDVKINKAERWAERHVKSLCQNYARAPHFERYAPELFQLLEKKHDYLLDLNLELLNWIRQQLGIPTPFVLSSSLGIPGSSVDRLLAILAHFGATRFYEGAAGRDYIDPKRFEQAGITIEFQDYRHPVYPQLHGEFVPYLSVIDLLFNVGPESLAVLTSASSKK